MGQKESHPFTDEQLEEMMDCTFLDKKQILRVFSKFQKYDTNNSGVLQKSEFIAIPELANNPFVERIAEVFSEDGSGDIQFEDFLDFMSIFSAEATSDVKASYAFRIYDFDEDGYIGVSDVKNILDLITKDKLTDAEKEEICNKIFGESDMDGDKKLSFVEFDHVVKRSPDFIYTFFIRV